MNFARCWFTVLLTLSLSSFAQAHTGGHPAGGFAAGFGHPLGGWDHLLAMLAVGLWAAQQGGRALWLVPVSFVTIMVLGGAAAMLGWPLGLVEQGILLSVLVLGLLIMAAARWPLWLSAGLVGLFACFHGYAHGLEMPAGVSGWTYGLGFVGATAGLHAVGMALGLALSRWTPAPVLRLTGAAIAVAGGYLWLA